MGPALIPTRIQAQSLTIGVSLSWGPRLGWITIADLGIKGDEVYIDNLVKVLTIAADVLREHRLRAFDTKQYYEYLTKEYNGYFRNTPDAEKPSVYKFDNYLFCWALKI